MKKERLTCVLMIVGGAMALVFGLLTAFIQGLAYTVVVYDLRVIYFPFKFQFHGFTFGLLISSVGGLLGIVSSLRQDKKFAYLAFIADFLGIFGFLLVKAPFTYDQNIFGGEAFFAVPWVGVCLTLVGVSVMFVGSMAESKGLPRLTLLGVPLLLAMWLMQPLLIAAKNFRLLISIYHSSYANALIEVLTFSGFALILLGSAFARERERVTHYAIKEEVIRKTSGILLYFEVNVQKLKRERLVRVLMIFGGAIALVFGLLAAFISGLASVWWTPAIVNLSLRIQLHRFTFGLLVSSVGGFLSLFSAVKHDDKLAPLGFLGNFLGVFGLLIPIKLFEFSSTVNVFFLLPLSWVGIYLTFIGVSMMLISSAAKCKGLPRLTLLGIPLLAVSWLLYPLLIIINNFSLLISIETILGKPLASYLIGVLAVLGFALTLSGSAFGIWKSRADLKRIIHA